MSDRNDLVVRFLLEQLRGANADAEKFSKALKSMGEKVAPRPDVAVIQEKLKETHDALKSSLQRETDLRTDLASTVRESGKWVEKIEKLTTDLAEARGLLREFEWKGYDVGGDREGEYTYGECCPSCSGSKPNHAPDCRLNALLQKAGKEEA